MVSFEPDPLFDLTVVGLPRNLNTFLSCVILIRDDLQLWIYFICEEGGGGWEWELEDGFILNSVSI